MGFQHGLSLRGGQKFAMVGGSWMTSVLCGDTSLHPFVLKEIHMTKFVKSFLSNESGATAIEYGLIAALIAVAAIAAMTTLGEKLDSTFTNVSDEL